MVSLITISVFSLKLCSLEVDDIAGFALVKMKFKPSVLEKTPS